MNQDFSKQEQDDGKQESAADAANKKLDVAARYIAELALLEARVQVARSCGA